MHTLAEVLNNRTWRELRAVTLAHALPFNGKRTREQLAQRAQGALGGRALRRAFGQLREAEVEALQALRAAGGALPAATFCAAFGEIPPYRPWRTPPSALPDERGEHRHPWRYTDSPAEKLWFLAFVEVLPGRQEHVVAPLEVLDLLPPLPRPRAVPGPHPARTVFGCPLPLGEEGDRRSLGVRAILRDVAALLGILPQADTAPRWGRWLPPRFWKAFAHIAAAPEPLDAVRSELQTGRFRFLHYLAEAAGLVAAQAGRLLPTVAAGRWLALPPAAQWALLWAAVARDLASRKPLWNVYRLPAASSGLWAALLDSLRDLRPGQAYTVGSLAAALRPYLPGESEALEGLPALLAGPLAWAGLVGARGDHVAVTAEGASLLAGGDPFPPPGDAALSVQREGLWLALPDVPRAAPLAAVLAWATVDARGARVDAAALRRAAAAGYRVQQVAGQLAALCGGPLLPEVYARLAAWAGEAGRLTLRQTAVLTAPDSALLARLKADRALRPLLGAALSGHHLAVPPEHVPALAKKLARRDLPLTAVGNTQAHIKEAPGPDKGLKPLVWAAPVEEKRKAVPELLPELAQQLWLAVRVYQQLGEVVPLSARIPGSVSDWLARLAGGDVPQDLAAGVMDQVAQAVEGRAPLASPLAQDDPQAVRAAVERAFAQRAALTVDYFSPAAGAVTRRTIEPLLPPAEDGGALYIEAWCRTADAARTFRLDRILRIVAEFPAAQTT